VGIKVKIGLDLKFGGLVVRRIRVRVGFNV
jgi:hypothetical protein